MGPDMLGGWWIIFPLLMCGAMVFFMMSKRGHSKPPWSQDEDRQGGESTAGETALGILSKRFAKGEITKEEFEEMKRAI